MGHYSALRITIRSPSMLKVTTKEAQSSLTFVLEGRLCRPWTVEAERGWTKLVSSAGNKKLLLDLAGVTFVDGDGEALLALMIESGTKVRAGGVQVSHLVTQVQKRMQRKSRRFSRSTPRPRRDPGVP
jgi:anti-anti-sigma regulatory factor